jgi:phosphoglucosamine mutase
MFGTSGIRGPVGDEVTSQLAIDLGRAVAADGYERVVVGRDARTTSPALADAVSAGLREGGSDVIDVGRAPTPTIARAVGWRDADAGIAVTASHNPPADNGFKLWQPSGRAFGAERRDRIAELIRSEDVALADWDAYGDVESWPRATDRHVEALVAAIEESGTGSRAADPNVTTDLHVVVDVGNGVGGVTATALRRLGCRVETLNAQPDGHFPGRPSEPTAEHCTSLRNHVGSTDADLGIAHDGDADRTMAVDETGRFVTGDRLLALFARDAVAAGDLVAAPVNTSMAVDAALEPLEASIARTRVGDVFVAERLAEPDAVFGGEPSGAWIWPGETRCPDGPLAACRLADLVARRGSLSDQLAEIEIFPLVRESIAVDRKGAVMDRVSARVEDDYPTTDVSTIDGVRVGFDDGWFLIRASGTQPLIRITAEARDEDRAAALATEARQLVEDERT